MLYLANHIFNVVIYIYREQRSEEHNTIRYLMIVRIRVRVPNVSC